MGSIAQAINHRVDGVKYPLNPPDGWIFMAFALDYFGPRALELGGSYRDFAWSEVDIDPVARNKTWDREWQGKVRRRLPRLVRAFNSVMASGEVKSGYSAIGGGAVTPMNKDWWRTDDPLLRYRTFSIDPADPYSQQLSLPCWVWIEQTSLERTTDRLYRERKGWGPLPEGPPPFPRTERYLRDDGQIEVWSYDQRGAASVTVTQPQPSPKAGRPSMTTRIHKLFADHLRNGTVAERVAWEGEAIRREYGGEKPPQAETCADRIRRFYNMIVRDDDGRVVNAGKVLDAMEYPINPDKFLSIGIN